MMICCLLRANWNVCSCTHQSPPARQRLPQSQVLVLALPLLVVLLLLSSAAAPADTATAAAGI
jgi:hypothetical protein